MIKRFFLLAFRNFLKNKAFVAINVLGLGTALGCCIVAYMNYRFEADYNTMHVNLNKIYKVNVKQRVNDQLQNHGISPVSLGPAMASEIPGIDFLVRYTQSRLSIRYKEDENDPKVFTENIGFADKDFFRMFTFPMKWGDSTLFEDQSKILLGEETSEKIFGKQNPIGKVVAVFNEKGKGTEFIVGGVYKEIPHNSIVYFDAIALYQNYVTMNGINEYDWKSWTAATFLQVTNPTRVKEIESLLNMYIDIQNKNLEEWKIEKYYIQSLKKFTRDSNNIRSNWVGTDLHPAQTITLIIMALFLLLLACFNYINTSIAISNNRLKEIGIRKVVGSSRIGLIVQFIGENFLICIIALFVSLFIGSFLGNEYNKMLSFDIFDSNFTSNILVWKFLAIILIFTTILSTTYPAFYISSFKPLEILKGSIKFSGTDAFSKLLLILQFSISLIGLISSIAFAQNAVFQKNFDFGYNKDQIITIPVGSPSNLEMLRESVDKNPGVIETIASRDHIPSTFTTKIAKYIDQYLEVRFLSTYSKYCSFMDIKFVNGREFTPEFESSDINRSAIVNENLVKEFKWDDPIGKEIKIDTLSLIVVGVVKNFYQNLFYPIMPTVMIMTPKDHLNKLLIKADKSKLLSLNNQFKKDWGKLIPYAPYGGRINDINYEYSQIDNKNILKVFNFLSGVAIFLSLIALYTLVSLNIIKRKKEIGIRKVFWTPSFRINYLIVKPFFFILLLASIVGGYGGYFLSQTLLSSVWTHHVNVNISTVSIPVFSLLIVALFTISAKVYYTLWKNPINSLRSE
jgi:ABC-type antimicrobial peptide transport system permease subunit